MKRPFIVSVIILMFLSCNMKHNYPANIILILIDDMGWKDLTCTGSTYYQTPNIDQFAAEGLMFTRGYSTSPVCSPSRGAIFSGKSPARTGFTSVYLTNSVEDTEIWHPYSKSEVEGNNSQYLEAMNLHVLPRSEYTFAEALRDAGYKTGYLGKWHCGWHDNFSPDKQGFDYAEGFRNVPTYTKGHFGRNLIGDVKGLEDLKPDDDIADALTEKAVRFIEKNKDEPFLLVLSHYAVHAPYMAKKEVIEKYERIKGADQNYPVYAAMVESVDKSVGRINSALKGLELEENTLVVFTSDNGGLTRTTDSGVYSPTSNYPLLGGKSMAYEASMRVPFIVKWPDRIKGGQSSDTPVVSTDLYPTFLEAAGIRPIPEQHKDGLSLNSEFSGIKLPDRELHFHFPHYTGYTSPYSVIIDDDWKLIRFYNDAKGGYQLFNMKDDPYELNDLSEINPDKVQVLSRKMNSWQIDAGAKLPRRNPDFNIDEHATKTGLDCYEIALTHREQSKERLKKSTGREGED
ncbi:MAG: sulfatase [Cytophagales bacterium]|nr:sulfatase [Cytophagales bacterium]